MTGRSVSMTNFAHPFVAMLVNNADFESNPRRVETFQNEVRKPRHRTVATGAHIWVAINGFSFVACQPIKVLAVSRFNRPARILFLFLFSVQKYPKAWRITDYYLFIISKERKIYNYIHIWWTWIINIKISLWWIIYQFEALFPHKNHHILSLVIFLTIK